jgi:sulfite exporter TauE/SafE
MFTMTGMNSLWAILVASFLGSPHCAGMCGGFAAYCGKHQGGRVSIILYNLGRLTTYVSLGLCAGGIGAFLNKSVEIVGLSRFAAIILGSLMIGWGLLELLGLWREQMQSLKSKVQHSLLHLHSQLAPAGQQNVQPAGPQTSFLIGLLSTFLPCGWLYGFVAIAAATGAAWSGALVMFVFWIGTVPLMYIVGAASQSLMQRLGARHHLVASWVLILAGVLSILGHFDHTHMHHSHGQNTEPLGTHMDTEHQHEAGQVREGAIGSHMHEHRH